jgi:hypothetical protein
MRAFTLVLMAAFTAVHVACAVVMLSFIATFSTAKSNLVILVPILSVLVIALTLWAVYQVWKKEIVKCVEYLRSL